MLFRSALAWVLRNDVISSPIIGPTRMQHLTDATAALEISLDPAEIEALESSYEIRTETWFN